LLTIVGGYAWICSIFLCRRWEPRHAATIDSITDLQDVTELTITAERPHRFQPGQFLFFAVTESQAGLPDEQHPFSISAIVDPHTFRISAKRVGDYTARLAELVPGDRVVVFGGYGSFGIRGLQPDQPAIRVAGGIGITPFLSMVRHLAHTKTTPPTTSG
jgi:predicted ferric reductase